MNLIEAHKSGRPFRRKIWTSAYYPKNYYTLSDASYKMVWVKLNGEIMSVGPNLVELVADDYELLNKKECKKLGIKYNY